jgi:uncharacterized protein (DUF362 family)
MQTNQTNSFVSVAACQTYELDAVRQAVRGMLTPLGGMRHFVRPGMRVLLKPNLLSATEREQAVTTHPAVVRAVTELVQEAGGTVIIGDSPAGAIEKTAKVYRKSEMSDVAEQCGATMVHFNTIPVNESY